MQVLAIIAHRSAYPDPISFEPGDVLMLGERDDEHPGWIRVCTTDGKAGWAPEQYIDASSATRGIATATYIARELDIVAGEALLVHHELNDWLWVENARGDTGWVPKGSTDAG